MILIRRPWTQQPQGNFKIDWSNPITQGLAFCACYSDLSLQNLVNGEPGVKTVGTSRSVSRLGLSVYTATNNEIAKWTGTVTTSTGNGVGAFTFLSLSAPIAESNISALLSQCDGDSAPQGYLLANTSTGYGASAGSLTFGGISGLPATVNGYIDGGWHCYIAGRAGGTSAEHVISVDGVDVYTNTSGSSGAIFGSAASSKIFSTGINGYGVWFRPHPHVLQAAWNRQLTSVERASLGKNPWQLFTPLSVALPIADAAIVPPTLLTAYADQITTSSARPNVTFSRP